MVIGSLWLITAFLEFCDFCYIWQLKEYRKDRFRDFLSTEQGRRYFKRPLFVLKYSAFLIAIFYPINILWHLQYILLGTLIIETLFFGFQYFHHSLKRPRFTLKALLIIGISLLTNLGLAFITKDYTLIFLIFSGNFFLTSFIVGLSEVPTRIYKMTLIFLATKKIQKYKNITVIGITGSYGKSSVKEFLSHILSQKYSIIKTPKNTNSEIGIAKFILQTNFSEAKYFIVEMGAYTIGEIELICKMVHPKIGILTTIAEQHLSLFGSMKNIQTAKYELLRSIPQNGLAVTNSDNAYCTEFLSQLQCKNIQTFGTEEQNNPTCLTTDILLTKQGTEFEGTYIGEKCKIKTPVIGAHHASNIAPSTLVSLYCGLTQEEVLKACETLPTNIQGSLQMYSFEKATIIDDSYNSNHSGFKSALDVLSTLFSADKKRIVITRGMLELGEKSDELHEQIGEEIAFSADELIVITPDFFEALKRGIGEKYHTKVRFIDDAEKLLVTVQELAKTDCVILIENRLPIDVYKLISKNRQPSV
jgi:UDP-N-acetylmuramoyl-tripeptide--D-alanyl-D-alanine ligase